MMLQAHWQSLEAIEFILYIDLRQGARKQIRTQLYGNLLNFVISQIHE